MDANLRTKLRPKRLSGETFSALTRLHMLGETDLQAESLLLPSSNRPDILAYVSRSRKVKRSTSKVGTS